MAISQDTLRRIKAASLSDVIEASGGKLKRVGHEYLTQCLWHEDSNPSLTVSDQKGFCFCHVCRGGGDALDYLQQKTGMGLRESAEHACDILGLKFEATNEDPEALARRKAERAAAISVLEGQQDRFRAAFTGSKGGRIRGLWTGRGMTPEASKEFQIGYAPDGEFGGRITVPIYDHRGQLVGFTGRATKSKEEQPAKYKNSADSDIFQKKLLVFNEHRARDAAREAGCTIFVEGHLDVVAMWQAGIRNVVAAQGTGAPDITVLKRLARANKNFVLCFDGDAGGRKAAEQFISAAGPLAMSGECSIKVATLPEGEDPDSLIQSGGDLYHYIAGAPNWLDWVIDTWAASLDKSDTAMVTEVEKKMRALINDLQSKALRTHYIDKAARVLAEDARAAAKLAASWGSHAEMLSMAHTWKPRDIFASRTAAERRMLRIFVHRPGQRDFLRDLLDKVDNPALRWLAQRLLELEQCSTVDLTPHSVMAVVAVAEPHYMSQLRTLVRPNVIIDDKPSVIAHIRDIMENEVLYPAHEPDTDQPFA